MNDLINLITEQTGSQLTQNAAVVLGNDTAYRIQKIVYRAVRFMKHANRTTLTCNDINRSLKWSNSQQIFGHECNATTDLTFSYQEDAKVFTYDDPTIELSSHINSNCNTQKYMHNQFCPLLDVRASL